MEIRRTNTEDNGLTLGSRLEIAVENKREKIACLMPRSPVDTTSHKQLLTKLQYFTNMVLT